MPRPRKITDPEQGAVVADGSEDFPDHSEEVTEDEVDAMAAIKKAKIQRHYRSVTAPFERLFPAGFFPYVLSYRDVKDILHGTESHIQPVTRNMKQFKRLASFFAADGLIYITPPTVNSKGDVVDASILGFYTGESIANDIQETISVSVKDPNRNEILKEFGAGGQLGSVTSKHTTGREGLSVRYSTQEE